MKHEPTSQRVTISISPAEKILVRLMLEDMAVVGIVRNNLNPFDFKNSEVRHLVEKLFGLDTENTFIDTTKLINYLEDKVSSNVISFIVNDEIEIKDKDRNVSDCIKAIKKQNRDERLKEIQSRLNLTRDKGYEDETRGLLEEFNRLIKTKELTHEKE